MLSSCDATGGVQMEAWSGRPAREISPAFVTSLTVTGLLQGTSRLASESADEARLRRMMMSICTDVRNTHYAQPDPSSALPLALENRGPHPPPPSRSFDACTDSYDSVASELRALEDEERAEEEARLEAILKEKHESQSIMGLKLIVKGLEEDLAYERGRIAEEQGHINRLEVRPYEKNLLKSAPSPLHR